MHAWHLRNVLKYYFGTTLGTNRILCICKIWKSFTIWYAYLCSQIQLTFTWCLDYTIWIIYIISLNNYDYIEHVIISSRHVIEWNGKKTENIIIVFMWVTLRKSKRHLDMQFEKKKKRTSVPKVQNKECKFPK